MKLPDALLCTAAMLFCVIPTQDLRAQAQQPPSAEPTLRVNSNLVFLDITVLDKKGHPVVSGLTKNDFTITEDKTPQSIFSFEAPEVHVMNASAGDENPEGKAPVTILVLDLLNSDFEDFAYIRYEVRNFLMAQPPQLDSPAEMMVIGNDSLEMLQGYTRDRADLLYALDHLPTALPIKKMIGAFFWDRFGQSIDALQQIALQNRGVPGRKNIVWVGHGGPNINLSPLGLPARSEAKVMQYVHDTTNMLVDARMSLFVIYPGLKVEGLRLDNPYIWIIARQADANLGNDDPFAGDVNFGVFVNETGGKLFYNRNDVDMAIAQSENMGAKYYTLTYQPHDVVPNGKFRRIRVNLRDPNLHAVTKAGYFAPDSKAPIDPRQQALSKLAEVAQASIAFTALEVRLTDVVRHPDARTMDCTVQLKSKNVPWLPADDGKNNSKLTFAAVSLNRNRKVLASTMRGVTLATNAGDMRHLPDVVSKFQFTIRIPRDTRAVRVVLESQDGGRIGAAELNWQTIDAAPESPTPEPFLVQHPPKAPGPASIN
jgi:VWFA-related protein